MVQRGTARCHGAVWHIVTMQSGTALHSAPRHRAARFIVLHDNRTVQHGAAQHSMARHVAWGALQLCCLLFWLQVPSSQPFPGAERPYGPDGNATLPPDWKHLGAPPQGSRGKKGQLLGKWQPYIWGSALGGGEDQLDPFPLLL